MNAEAVEERRRALRELLAAPFIGADEPAYALVRRHEPELSRLATDVFGYELRLGARAARLVGPPTERSSLRALRVPPGSASGRTRPRSQWAELSDRGVVLLLCTLAALERGGAQVALAELARDTVAAGADCEPPIEVDFLVRGERLAFADGLELLVDWGVLEHTAGSQASYRTLEQGEDEALLTIDRKRLAMVLRDPAGALAAQAAHEVGRLGEQGYAPTADGRNRALAHELARRLLEDPVLLLEELDEAQRAYFLGQRARLEDAVHDATGMDVERRAEGTALVTDDRALTDVRFPTRSTVGQLALLLCDLLRGEAPVVARPRVITLVRRLAGEHQDHWQRDPRDPAIVTALAEDAVALLAAVGLVALEADGAARVLAPAHRFRDPDLRRARGASA